MNKKRFTINLLANVITFVLNLCINFLVSPFIVEHLGVEANGYVTLSTTIVNYANVFTVALNSMFGRYIAIEMHKGNYEKARKYFSTVFYANCICALIFSLVGAVVSINIGGLLSVSETLVRDVQLTFALTFLNYILGLIFTVFSVCTFVKNRLDLSSLCSIIQYVIRAIVLLMLFVFCPARVFYVPLAGVIVTIVSLFIYTRYTRVLTPELKISKNDFGIGLAVSIIKEGVWFSLQQINKVLETGLDLLISNQFISGVAMGSLSIAKTIPNMIYMLTTTIANVFSPMYAQLYAENKKEELVKLVKMSITVMSIFLMPIMIGFVVFGEPFFVLWQPTLDESTIQTVQILSILTILPTLFNGYVEGLYYINILTNKVKTSVLVTFGFSAIAVIVEIILLLLTDGGVFIVAGTSALFMSIRYLCFTPIYCAYVLELKWNTFLFKLLRAVVISGIELAVFTLIRNCFVINSWVTFIIPVVLTGLVGYVIAFVLVPENSERKQIISLLNKKLVRK